MPNYNAPEFKAAVDGEIKFNVDQTVNRFNKVAKLVALKGMDPNAKVAQADINAVENTSLPVVCLAVAAMRKVGTQQVTAADAINLYPDLAKHAGLADYLQGHHLPGAGNAMHAAGDYVASHHMPGKEDVAEYLESHHLPGMQGRHVPGMQGAGTEAAEYLRSHHMPGMADVAAHPGAAAAAAGGAGALAGLGAAQAMRHKPTGKKK